MNTFLPTTRLGWTGMFLTRVGFGAWAIGGGDWAYAWGHQDDAASVAAIRHAVESGINWIDTAAVYGLGHSEEVVAAALAGLPEADRPYVFTKGGQVWDPADRSAKPRRVGAPASIRTEVEASLRRLRVEQIDLYQMHWPAEDGTPVQEYWQVFTDLKREGKIRAAGLSNHGILQLEAAEEIGAVDAIQPRFNLIHRDAADDVLLWAREHEAGVIVYSPMASGLLTGTFTAARAAGLEPGDWRASHPDFTEPALSANLALADVLRPVAERHGVTPAAVAVAWTLAFPGVTGAIVGARNPGQVDGWLPAATLELKEDDLSDIAAAIRATGAGTGPVSPSANLLKTGTKLGHATTPALRVRRRRRRDGRRLGRRLGRREGGGEQVAGGQAAVGPPLLGDGQDLLLGRQVVQRIGGLDGLAERQVARQHDVLAPQRDEQRALHGPRADAGNRGELGQQLIVGQGGQYVLVQPAVRHPLGQVAQRADLTPGQAGLAELAGIDGQQFGGRGEMPVEQRLDAGHGAAGGRDGQLLAGDLEQQGAVQVHRRQLGQPRPGVEVRPFVDEPSQYRIGVAQVGARLLQPCGVAGVFGHGAHRRHYCSCSFSRRSVRTISMIAATVSWRAQSR